jgi:predicted transcriptional regulator
MVSPPSKDGGQVWKEITVEENQYAAKHRVQNILSKEIEIRKKIKKACWQNYPFEHFNQRVNVL